MYKLDSYNQLKNDLFVIELEIEKYSIYKYDNIIPILVNLIDIYEKCSCSLKYLYDDDGNEQVIIEIPNKKSIEIPNIDKSNHGDFIIKNEDSICFLPPKKYLDLNNFKGYKYIQQFIDYIFNKRYINKNKKINENQLNDYLNEFLIINGKVSEKNMNKEINKRRCVVSRLSMYKAIVNLVNNYNKDGVVATYNTFKSIEDNSNGSKTFSLSQELIIKNKNNIVSFNTIVDTNTVFEEDFESIELNKNRQTNINFYALNDNIESIYRAVPPLKVFMKSIEKLFNEKTYKITDEQIDKVLLDTKLKIKTKRP